MTTEQERQELHRTIWSIADDLRGAVDGWDFKNYVIITMFYRYISEDICSYLNKNEIKSGNKDFDYEDIPDDKITESLRGEIVKEKGFFIFKVQALC